MLVDSLDAELEPGMPLQEANPSDLRVRFTLGLGSGGFIILALTPSPIPLQEANPNP